MPSKIVITFGSDPGDGEKVDFSIAKIGNPSGTVFKPETFKFFTRIGSGQIKIPTPTGTPGEASAIEYEFYWRLDYGGISIWSVTRILNVVTIIVADSITLGCYIEFNNFTSDDVGVTAVISNCAAITFNVTDFTVAATHPTLDPCVYIRATVTTDELAVDYALNGNFVFGNGDNPFTLDIIRGFPSRIEMINSVGDSIFYPTLDQPKLRYGTLSVGIISLEILQSLNGATVTVIVDVHPDNNPVSVFEYKVDAGGSYGSDNVFTGQANGSYTIYVKDEWGCEITKDYEVTDAGTRSPFMFISKASAVNFSESEVTDGCVVFKNDINSLALQGLEDTIYCVKNLFQTCDPTKLQFKSNYDTPTIKLRKEDLSEVSITLNKKSSNLNRFQRLDCWYYKYKEGLLGLYFTSGQTYDNLGIPLDTFTLNGNLPDFAIIGQFIDIDILGIFKIVDIVFDATIIRKAIIVEFVYNGAPVLTIVESVFDLLPYEIYEFEIDWNTYGEGYYDILIDNTDAVNGTIMHLSENIYIQDIHNKTLAIRYFNNNNRDIFYKYGIEHFIRMEYSHIEAKTLDESEINIGDLISTLVESSIHEINKFYFEEMTKEEMRKIVVALSCENLFINGIGYIKNDEIEVENLFGTNLYTVTAILLKTNINYNNNRQGQEGLDDGTIEFNIPAFVLGDGGFVKS